MNNSSPKLWGVPTDVVPLPPSDDDLKTNFKWDHNHTTLPPPDVTELLPSNPIFDPPVGFVYPRAATDTHNIKFDPEYVSGYYFYHNWFTSKAADDLDRMIHAAIPPNVGPKGYHEDSSVIEDNIPEMHCLIPGYVVVAFVDGIPRHKVTKACVPMLQSLQQWPKIYEMVMDILTELYPLIWGQEATNEKLAMKPIYKFLVVHNSRSSGQKEGLYDGSYNLAGTSSEGQGSGLLMPANQTSDKHARLHIAHILQLIHMLYHHIMPLCVLRLEWAVMEFHGTLCNIISFGGLKPGPTSCQLIVSSSTKGGDLAKFIGELQGAPHVDKTTLAGGLSFLYSFASLTVFFIFLSLWNHP